MGVESFFTSGHKIQRNTIGQDSEGGITSSWADHLTLDGKLWQLSGDKRLSQDKLTIFADHKFACEIADITEKDRYLDPDGNPYTIKAIATRTRPDETGHIELSLEKVK